MVKPTVENIARAKKYMAYLLGSGFGLLVAGCDIQFGTGAAIIALSVPLILLGALGVWVLLDAAP